MINNKKFNILIIDNNKVFNTELTNKIQQYKFNVTQVFEEKNPRTIRQIFKIV